GAGWSLQSVENNEVNELFSFINPTIKLPVKSLQLQLENKIKNDPVGVTLCFDDFWPKRPNSQMPTLKYALSKIQEILVVFVTK
ncbi:9614_t:CDS:2, partial [Entrophospora sp. SA101]